MKNSTRYLSIVLCMAVIISCIPAVVSTASEKEYNDKVLERFDYYFESSTSYDLLKSNDFYYRQWADNVENSGAVSKIFQWSSLQLLDKNLDKESCTLYILNLLAMLDSGFTESTVAKAKDSMISKAQVPDGGLIKVALSAFFEVCGEESIKDIYSELDKTYDFAASVNKTVTDIDQLAVAVSAAELYEQKMAVLDAISNNTDNKHIKNAIKDIKKLCELQYVYILDDYIWSIGKNAAELEYDLLDSEFFKNAFEKAGAAIESGFSSWVKKHSIMSDAALRKLLKVSAAFLQNAKLFALGVKIGAELMKPIVEDKAEYFREEMVMDELADALVSALDAAKAKAEGADSAEKLDAVNSFVYIGRMLSYVHMRGEYCDMLARDGTIVMRDYYQSVCVELFSAYNDVSDILTGKGIYAIADGTDGGLSSYLVRAKNPNVPNNYYGYVDIRTGQMVLEQQFEDADEYFGSDGWAKITVEGECAVINTEGKHLLPFGTVKNAKEYYEGQCMAVTTKDRRCLLYCGEELIKELEIPTKEISAIILGDAHTVEHHIRSTYYVLSYSPERYIPITVVKPDDSREYYWYDINGELICQVDTNYGVLAGDSTGYYFFKHVKHESLYEHYVDIFDTEGKLVHTEELATTCVPSVAYDGDAWYAACNTNDRGGSNWIYTNGLNKLDVTYGGSLFAPSSGSKLGRSTIFASEGIIAIRGGSTGMNVMYIKSNGMLFYCCFSDYMYGFNNGYAKVENGKAGLYSGDFNGFIDINGLEVYPFEDEPENYSNIIVDGYFFYKKGGFWGIKNIDGSTVIPAVYEDLGGYNFDELYLSVK